MLTAFETILFPPPLWGRVREGGDISGAGGILQLAVNYSPITNHYITPHLGLPKGLPYSKPKANRPLPQGERKRWEGKNAHSI